MEVELSIDEAMKGSGGGVDYAVKSAEGPRATYKVRSRAELDALLGSLSGQALRLAKTPPRQ